MGPPGEAVAGLGAILAEQDAAADQNAILAIHTAILVDRDAILASQNAILADQKPILADWDAILASQNAILADQKAILADQDAILTRCWGDAKLETHF